MNAVRVEDRHAEFADGCGGETDTLGYPCQKWEERGLPEALVVDGGVPRLRADFCDGLADAGEIAGIDGPDFGGEAAAGDEIGPAGMR